MPFRFHANSHSGYQRWIWVDETSRIVVEGDDTSQEQMRDAEGTIHLQVLPHDLLAMLGATINNRYRVIGAEELSKELVYILKCAPKHRWRLTSYRLLMNYVRDHLDEIRKEIL